MRLFKIGERVVTEITEIVVVGAQRRNRKEAAQARREKRKKRRCFGEGEGEVIGFRRQEKRGICNCSYSHHAPHAQTPPIQSFPLNCSFFESYFTENYSEIFFKIKIENVFKK